MARTKRSSKAIDGAEVRINGLKSISPTLDLGGGLTVVAYEQAIDDTQALLDDYNQTLSSVDEKLNNLIAAENNLKDQSARMLSGVAARYGTDSDEYEKAGGVRRSERRRPTRTSSEPPASNP